MGKGIIDNLFQIIRKHSPEILVGLGVTGVVAGTVMACKETTELQPIIDEHHDQIEEIHKASANGVVVDQETKQTAEYTEKDTRRDLTRAYFRTGGKLVKLYWPSVLLISGSIGCILGSHDILSKRNTGLMAAYAGLSETFNNYRKNIVEKFGETADTEARYPVKAKKVKGKNGEEDSVEYSKVDRLMSDSDHSRFFDAESIYWDKHVNRNLIVLQQTQTNLNRKLKLRRSHMITLNEVYDALDLKPSKDGQILGYKYRPDDPLDENGNPMTIQLIFYVLSSKGQKTTKTVSDAIVDGDVTEPVMLLDFPGVEVLI